MNRKRGGKTTSGNGLARSSPNPRGQWRTERKTMKETCCEVSCGAPTTPHGYEIGGGEGESDDTSGSENVANVPIFPLACFAWLFY